MNYQAKFAGNVTTQAKERRPIQSPLRIFKLPVWIVKVTYSVRQVHPDNAQRPAQPYILCQLR